MGLLELLGGVGDVLDTPGRFTRTALAGRNPFSAVFDPSQGVSGRDLLQQYGMVGENQDGFDGGDVGGFLAEMLLDPTNLIGGMGLAKKLVGASRARAANKGIEAANKLSLTQRLQGFMPEEVAKLTKIVDETGAPKKMYHGTPAVFDRFDAEKFDPNALYGKGVYTTDSPLIASDYSDKGRSALASSVLKSDGRIADLNRRKELVKDYARNNRQTIQKLPNEAIDEVTRLEGRWEKSWDVRDKLDEMLEARRNEVLSKSVAPNVRQHYIDARNPFDIEATHSADEINRIVRTVHPKANYDEIVGKYGIDGDTFMRDAVTSQDLGNQMLKKAGYDAINHTGGRNTGGAAHNVTIALDPSQVYLPYIAKEIQELKKIPKVGPLLASLLGQQAMARFARRRPEDVASSL